MKTFLITFCLLAALYSRAQNNPDPDFQTRVDSQVWALMTKHHIVGTGIALFDADRVILQQGYGFADLHHKQPIQTQSIFRIASITKTFTALAVLQLKEAGKIDLQAPVEQYLPDLHVQCAQEFRKITVSDLLTHTAGLTDDFANGSYSNQPVARRVVIDWLNQEVLTIAPGLKKNYSNIGYALLGYLIETVSGQSYADYIEQHVFAPLHMDHSSVSIDSLRLAWRVKGYRQDSSEFDLPLLRDQAAGGIESSLPDLIAFAQMLLHQGQVGDNRLISKEMFADMSGNQLGSVALAGDDQFGYGLFLQRLGTDQDEQIGHGIGHGGTLRNHHSVLMVYPKLNLGVIVLANTEGAGPFTNALAVRLLRTYLEKYKGLTLGKAVRGSFSARALAADRLDHRQIQGTYGGGGEDYFRIKSAGQKKLKFLQAGSVLVLRRSDNNIYSVKYRLLKFIPIRVKNILFAFQQVDGNVYVKVLNAKSKTAEYISRRDPDGPLDQRWRSMQGQYEVANTCSGNDVGMVPVALKCLDQKIVLYRQGDTAELTDNLGFYALNASVAIADGIDRGAGATLKILPNGNLYYSGFELRKVR